MKNLYSPLDKQIFIQFSSNIIIIKLTFVKIQHTMYECIFVQYIIQ